MLTDSFWRDLILIGVTLLGTLASAFAGSLRAGSIASKEFTRQADHQEAVRLAELSRSHVSECLDLAIVLEDEHMPTSILRNPYEGYQLFGNDVLGKMKRHSALIADSTVRNTVERALWCLSMTWALSNSSYNRGAEGRQQQTIVRHIKEVLASYLRGEDPSPQEPAYFQKLEADITAAMEEKYSSEIADVHQVPGD